ncbi:protein SCAI [Quillaja saponaria]|uniref:Protein SCAI n=1 Tax=Quillaja saponaria TaxID=32244 RepID=A0AAD7P883_QUISA|nr:protein SCAI [Quillaja saponaria]
MSDNDVVPRTFRALVESADQKFARVRDVPAYGSVNQNHYFQKVFKAYTRLWKYQQENRAKLVEFGLKRWEIGEIASRIGQLYFSQYMRTSEARFLVEAYVFYEAILSRKYFEGSGSSPKDLGVRFKELRFYARFLLVSLILNRMEMVKYLMERFMTLVEDCNSTFRETNFKEWRKVVQEIVCFMKVDKGFMNVRPFRYCPTIDTHRASIGYVARFHAKKVLKFRDALLTSFHRNEVKFAEFTLDTYRMLQCLEWEPSGSFYRKPIVKPKENGDLLEHSGASGLINMNLAMDMTDPTLPPNPRKAILYHPSVTHLIAVMATICEELPADSVMLIYLSASGKAGYSNVSQREHSGGSSKSSKFKVFSQFSKEHNSAIPESHINGNREPSCYYDTCLWFGSKGNGGSNNLYPGDIIPFTRKPLFLIIDSDVSHAFKVLNGAERGETAALFLSPLRPAYKNSSSVITHNGSQFTFFLTAPLLALCQMLGLFSSEGDTDIYKEAENILSNAFSEWEVILCKSASMDLAWAQILKDPILRRLILRFIFCRSVLSFFCPLEESEQYLPVCLPHLPTAMAPKSEAVRSAVVRLTRHLKVADFFHFDDT